MSNDESINIAPILQRIVNRALSDEDYAAIFEAFCEELANSGIPLLRAHLSMQTLHPLVESVALTWLRGRGLEIDPRLFTPQPEAQWLASPLYWMLSNNRTEFRQNLCDKSVEQRFPIFTEFRTLGGTDYFALLTPFGNPETAIERQDGIVTSWISDAPGGFQEHHIKAIRSLQPFVGLVSRLTKHDYTTRNVLSAYLGEEAGRRVLEGQIRLGDVVHIPAIIWYSDLRGSTALAETMPAESFLQTVNDYFNCTAGTILEEGGEVLRFIGDAVMAVFPVDNKESPVSAARQALIASGKAQHRLAELNKQRVAKSKEPLAFGLGLHMGELLFGNIGVPTRIEFSVIGRAANEVARLESLTKEVDEPVLVSHAFKELIDLPWRNLGVHRVKGVGDKMRVFAPPNLSGLGRYSC